MTMATRIALACTVVAAWFGILAPRLEHRIATATLEGPAPFSLQNLRDRIAADTGEPDPELLASMAALSRPQMAEEERVAAIWSLLGEAVIAEAKTQTDALPAPRYAVDPRFFEPMVPEIIRRTIELYGARSEPLPVATVSSLSGDREDRLRVVLAAVHHRLVTADQAPALLQGAYDLLELQMERMQLEDGIRSAHPAALSP